MQSAIPNKINYCNNSETQVCLERTKPIFIPWDIFDQIMEFAGFNLEPMMKWMDHSEYPHVVAYCKYEAECLDSVYIPPGASYFVLYEALLEVRIEIILRLIKQNKRGEISDRAQILQAEESFFSEFTHPA